MTTVLAMPHFKQTDARFQARQIASHRLPLPPLAPVEEIPKQKKTEAERAQRSKAALVHAARQRGLKGCTQMSREALARALSH